MRARLSPTWPDAASGDDSPVALLLHGYGSNEDDLPGLAPWLPDGLEWASLRAPIDMGGGGATWFPFTLPEEPEQAPIDAVTEALWEWVETHVPPNAPVVPLGFSQGGLMALQLLRTRPGRVAATVVLSGLITTSAQPADAELETLRPPVFWGRGDADPLIWPEAVERLGAWLADHSTPTIRVYPRLGHGVGDQELDDMWAFLAEHV
jgi:phospholipase/carboxylesterase